MNVVTDLDLAKAAFAAAEKNPTKDFKARAQDLPVLLRTLGLAATAATYLARADKSGDDRKRAYHAAYLFLQDASQASDLQAFLTGSPDLHDYRVASARCRRAARWLKTAAEAVIAGDER